MFTFSKNTIITVLLSVCSFVLIISCNNKSDYTITQKQVLTLHDKVMNEAGRAEGNEIQLKSLLKAGFKTAKLNQPNLDTAAVRAQILTLNKNLSYADDQMENWMHAYNNNLKGKTDEETLSYFNSEKVKVEKLDSLYQSALRSAGDYLKQSNVKPEASMASGKMKM